MEEKSLSYFEILILELKIISRTIEKTKAREIEIINIIFEGPKIAWNQKEIYQKILLGSDIKSNLNDLIFFSPIFTTFFRDLLKYDLNFERNHVRNVFQDYYNKKQNFFSQSLETRLNLLFFFSIFYPLGVLYGFGLNNHPINYFLISIGYFLLLQTLFSIFLFNKNHNLLGLNLLAKKTEKDEFKIFLIFFHALSQKLINSPPENAIYYSLKEMPKKNKEILHIKNINFLLDFTCFEDFLNSFFNHMKNSQLLIFGNFFIKIFKHNSAESAEFFREIFSLIDLHLEQLNIQESALKSALFRGIIYKILLSFILGILTPMVYQFQLVFSLFKGNYGILEENIGVFNNFDINKYNLLLVVLFSGILLLISVISINKIIEQRNIKKMDIIILVIFYLSLTISNVLWNNMVIL